MIRKSRATLLLMLALPALAQAVEILRWERIPLAIPLTVGQETRASRRSSTPSITASTTT